jgi:hypothetical protein
MKFLLHVSFLYSYLIILHYGVLHSWLHAHDFVKLLLGLCVFNNDNWLYYIRIQEATFYSSLFWCMSPLQLNKLTCYTICAKFMFTFEFIITPSFNWICELWSYKENRHDCNCKFVKKQFCYYYKAL